MSKAELASVPSRLYGDSLSRVVEEIEAAYAARDLDLTAALIQQNLLGAWFGTHPHRFGEILAALLRAGTRIDPVVQVVASVLFGGEADDELSGPVVDAHVGAELVREAEADGLASPDVETMEFGELQAINMRAAYRMFKMRMAGRVTESLESAVEMYGRSEQLQSLFDKNQAWSLFQSVQLGVTQMLAGDFRGALTSFARARMHRIVPSLEFLSRDACIRAALIEAFFGDEVKARNLLEESDRVPRTVSWTEPELDAAYTTVHALVSADTLEESRRMLESVSLQVIGEGWPFYLAAVQRVLLVSGDYAEAALRLGMYEQMPLPHIVGDGYSGSVLPLSVACAALRRGDMNEARQAVSRADQSLVPTRLLLALLDVASGDAHSALRASLALREETQGLRLLEVWRIIAVASSHHLLGEGDECARVLENAISAPFGLRPAEADLFPTRLQAFASETFEKWPSGMERPAARAFRLFELGQEALSPREMEALKLLADGLSREQIASRMFVSINTVKGYLRDLYRKLGVNSRNAAVREADIRGLL